MCLMNVNYYCYLFLDLEKKMATHSSILALEILWIERGAWWATVHGFARIGQLSNYESQTDRKDLARLGFDI